MNWILSDRALLDLRIILANSGDKHGRAIRARYRALLQQAIQDVADNPRRLGVQVVEGLPGFFIYHSRHARPRAAAKRIGRPRHLIVFRIAGERLIVSRILHDAMDIASWLQDI